MELEEFAFQGCPDVRGPKAKESPKKALNDNGAGENVSLETFVWSVNCWGCISLGIPSMFTFNP